MSSEESTTVIREQNDELVDVEVNAYGQPVRVVRAESAKAAIRWSHDPNIWRSL